MLLILLSTILWVGVEAGSKIGLLADPEFKKSGLAIMVKGPHKRPYLAKDYDGSEVWRVHNPPIIGTTEVPKKGVNIESVKYPGYFFMASKDKNPVISIEKPTDTDSQQRATFRQNLKVRTKASIFLMEGHEYEFVCNEGDKPYYLLIKTDDNSRFFADRCSYALFQLTKDEAAKRLGKPVPKSGRKPDGESAAIPCAKS